MLQKLIGTPCSSVRNVTRKMPRREARHGHIYINAYKVLLRARSNLIWVVKCMCVRCGALKYVYGSSMCP